ncbi:MULTISPECIES: AbrB family transcriptional regulator [unclassified Yoonia]|uniref:AbrB family transcriptional regulator n=1 Tax=unclassified Yoonia TaxID=2629118 RepID=UPI002AFE93B4|nr:MULTISPECIES: AbrB family transcriptional regulator [unclassified Yoonia]
MGQTIRGVEWRSFAITAAIAVTFGAVAWVSGLPVPWLLGALFGTATFTLGGVRLAVPPSLKTSAHACIGLILGASIEPETFARASQWPLTLLVLSVGMILVTTATAFYYIRVAGFDRLTATAASLTGGLTNIVAIAIQLGANPPGTVIGQLFRLTSVVVLLPLIYTGWLGTSANVPVVEATRAVAAYNLWILPLAWPAYVLAQKLRLPVPDMMGPLLVSTGFAVMGYGLVLPECLFAMVFIVVGASIGTRFYGLESLTLIRIGGHSAVATLILLLSSAALAYPFSLVAGVPFHVALLAVAPGGVAEIAILATILGVDPVFVTFHQVFRNIVLNAMAPFVLTRLKGKKQFG